MGNTGHRLRDASDTAAMILLFILNVCYIFAALGLLAFGVIMLPAALLGRTGLLVITTDLAPLPLLLISGGVLLLGLGMCFCIIPVCGASYGVLRRVMKTKEIRAKQRSEHSADTSDNADESGEEE